MKRCIFLLVLAAILLPANLMGKEVIEPYDSIWADTVAVDNADVDEVIEIVDTMYVYEDDMIIGRVFMESGEIVSDTIRLSDGENKNNRKRICDLDLLGNFTEVYSLDDCTTIDNRMTKRARKLLDAFVKQQQMENAQIVILDAKSGRLKTWISLDADIAKENAGKLLARNRHESPQLTWFSDMTNWFGYATTEYIYAAEDKERITPVGTKIQFAGFFPADSPRYTIYVVADKLSTNVSTSVLKDIVNPLTKWLLKNSGGAK